MDGEQSWRFDAAEVLASNLVAVGSTTCYVFDGSSTAPAAAADCGLVVLRVVGLQEAAVGGISLESSTEELSTLHTLWELQPFTNEAALHSISAAAASSADS